MPAKKSTARRSTAKKSTARRSTAKKSTARRSTAKKSTARRSTAKKSTARRSTAKKSTARRSTAKKSTARRSTAKKSTARRSTAKKSTARRSTAKKSTARRSTAKKSTARRSTAKKSTARRSTAKKSTGKRATTLRRAPVAVPASANNKATIRQIERAWNTSDLAALDEHFAPGYQNHAVMPGMQADLGTAKMAHGMAVQAFPDRNVEILDMVAEDDRVMIRTRVTGTNTGGAFWFDAPANDRAIDFESWALYRLEGGKVVESWGLNDGMRGLVQLGSWSPPPMPGA